MQSLNNLNLYLKCSGLEKYKVVITAKKKGVNLGLKELIRYRDLFLILAYRDYRVRYAQTFLGLFWAVLQPIVTVSVFTFVFGYLIKDRSVSNGLPYPVFVLSGMISWTYFSYVLTQSGQSIIGSQGMIQKIYFPRLIIPLSKAVVGFVDFFITLTLLIILLFYYQITPNINMLYIPLFVILIIISSLGVGIWMSALTIRYRDFQHIIPFMVQIGLYATPVAYSSDLIQGKLKYLYYINPMAGTIDGIRWSIFGTSFDINYFLISLFVGIFILLTGIYYFKKVEYKMADIV